ncbi:MAG: hypothetical protein WC955_04335 [Elusimicrobiota bacterium]
MKKALLAAVGLALVVTAFGCGGTKINVKETPKQERGIPNWVPLPGAVTIPDPQIQSGKVMQGVGMAEKRASFQAQMQTAAVRAKADLAGNIKTKVESVVKNTFGDWQEQGGVNPSENVSTAIDRTEGLIKNLVDTEISGPFVQQTYIDKDTGQIWIRVLLSADMVERWTKEKLRAQKEIRALMVDAKADMIADKLDKDIEKSREAEKATNDDIYKMMGVGAGQ